MAGSHSELFHSPGEFELSSRATGSGCARGDSSKTLGLFFVSRAVHPGTRAAGIKASPDATLVVPAWIDGITPPLVDRDEGKCERERYLTLL